MIETKVHSKMLALCMIHMIKTFYPKINIELIGSLGKGAEISMNDIDIHIKNKKKTDTLKNKLFQLLDAESVEDTDWGGWYFNNTFYGNVDVFFNINEFDY